MRCFSRPPTLNESDVGGSGPRHDSLERERWWEGSGERRVLAQERTHGFELEGITDTIVEREALLVRHAVQYRDGRTVDDHGHRLEDTVRLSDDHADELVRVLVERVLRGQSATVRDHHLARIVETELDDTGRRLVEERHGVPVDHGGTVLAAGSDPIERRVDLDLLVANDHRPPLGRTEWKSQRVAGVEVGPLSELLKGIELLRAHMQSPLVWHYHRFTG